MQANSPRGRCVWPAVAAMALLLCVACAPRGSGPDAKASAEPAREEPSASDDGLLVGAPPAARVAPEGSESATSTHASAADDDAHASAVTPPSARRVAGPIESDAERLIPPTSPADIARAKRLLARGANLYRRGDYEPAEEAIKEAMTLYPFLPEANLLLGKIFLIRGAAGLDRTLIDQARRMFEMARKLDPKLQESDLLLELFAPPEASGRAKPGAK